MSALGEENLNNSISYKAFLNSPYKSMKHSTYFQVYDHLFSNYINSEITFVEIGVLSGGSLFFWQDFFGPDARIIGIDFNPADLNIYQSQLLKNNLIYFDYVKVFFVLIALAGDRG